MTFTEAAIEVLKREGKPLPVKELTRLAIKLNLLLVIGRDPETTMQTRLQEESRRPAADLIQVSPGVFGLRNPPAKTTSRPTTSQHKEPGTHARGQKMSAKDAQTPKKKERPAAAAAQETETPQKSRSRGRRKGDDTAETPAASPEPVAEANEPAAQHSQDAHSDSAPPRRRRSGRLHAPAAETPAVVAAEASQQELPLPSEPAAAAAPEPAPAVTEAASPVVAEAPPVVASPVAAAAPAAPPVVAAPAAAPAAPAAPATPPGTEAPKESAAATATDAPREQTARVMPITEAVYDVLRGSSEGRPVHFRQITEIAVKRRLVRGEPVDISRLVRAAAVRDLRQRDLDGQRARIKNLGNGVFGVGDKKLEPELVKAENELADRVNRTREATRVALRRRIRALPASAFELLMRLLLEKIGMLNADLLKRGEGVAYYAGTLSRGSRNIKTLVAIRPGEAEVSAEAIAELRAGMRLRGFDEGLVLAAGRLSSAAQTELAAPGIDVYDQDPLSELMIRHQFGVRRLSIPMDYLDTDLFTEILEPA